MSVKVKVYEQFKDDKGEAVNNEHEMWSVDAREAVANGKGRFSLQPFVKADKTKAADKKS
jgi:hypothetical protein